MRSFSKKCCSVVCAGVAAGLGVTSVVAAPSTTSATVVAPTYIRTLGQSGQAQLYPSGLDVDASGAVVVADTGNDRVEFFSAGTTVPLWSVGVRGLPVGATVSFENPRDVAVDDRYVYVADTDNQVIQVLNKSDGTFVGTFSLSLNTPIGVKIGSDGAGHERILVADGGSGKVEIFDGSFNHVLSVQPTTRTEGTRGAATDSLGNIYTADYRNDRVDKYSPTGSLLLQWGGASAPLCQQVPKPYGVAVDAANHVYVASSDLELVKEFNPDGSCVSTFGQKGTGSGQLVQLRRVAVGRGSSPLVYAADLWGLKVLTYNQDGSLSSAQPQLGNGTYPVAGGLNEVHGIAVTSSNVFVTDTVNQRMQRFNLDGSNPFVWGTKGVQETTASFNWAQGVGVDPLSGNLWVANTRNNRIDEFGPDGSGPLRVLGQRVGSGAASFNWPMAVVFDPAGNMYVADTFNNRIQSFAVAATGTPTPRWAVGTRGTGVGNFSHPFSLVYDNTNGGRVLVADTNNDRVVSLNPATGAWLGVLAITKGTAPGRVSKPTGIAISSAGMIWIADTGNNRIEMFNPDGTFANEMVGSYGTSNTQFNAPQGIAIGPDGLLYVADTSNNRVQVFQP